MWRAKAVLVPAVPSQQSVSADTHVLYAGNHAATQPQWLANLLATRPSRQRQAEEWSQLMRVVVPALILAVLLMAWCSGMPLFSR